MEKFTQEDREASLEAAILFHKEGHFNQALDLYNEIIDSFPNHVGALHLAGQALLGRHDEGDLDSAINLFHRAIALDDRHADCHNDLGTALWNKHDIDTASMAFLRALELKPDFVQANFNLGNCYWLNGEVEQALQSYKRTVSLDDDWAQAWYMMANCLLTLGRTESALSCYNRVIDNPKICADASYGKSVALLKLGKWHEGWRLYERRIDTPALSAFRNSRRPQWNGERDEKCILMVYGEQGLGDLLMYARFLNEVRQRVKHIILVCDRSLHRLLESLETGIELVDKDAISGNLDQLHFHKKIAIMSLTRVLQITPDSIPNKLPYLNPDEISVRRWKDRLGSEKFNVGIVWSGNPEQKDDRFRSCPLDDFGILADVDGVQFYSIQKRESAEALDINAFPDLIDVMNEIEDFADTAALITAMDLVICVDTAVSHLAGALGKPVWNLLWVGHCWRYFENRDDSPWYPSMRLFKQTALGDWESVIRSVKIELLKQVSQMMDT